MKKLLTLACLGMLIVGLTGCFNGSSGSSSSNNGDQDPGTTTDLATLVKDGLAKNDPFGEPVEINGLKFRANDDLTPEDVNGL